MEEQKGKPSKICVNCIHLVTFEKDTVVRECALDGILINNPFKTTCDNFILDTHLTPHKSK